MEKIYIQQCELKMFYVNIKSKKLSSKESRKPYKEKQIDGNFKSHKNNPKYFWKRS